MRALLKLMIGLVVALVIIVIITAIAVHFASSKKATGPTFSPSLITPATMGW